MSNRNKWVVWSALLAALAATPSPAGAKEKAAWRLGEVRVVEAGTTAVLAPDRNQAFPGGMLVSGRVLEAKVSAKAGAIVPDGTFRLVLSAFKPDADMPGQKAGVWHVEGKWTIVDAKADPAALATRHNPFVLEGHVRAALPFSPLERANWTAAATLPPSRAGGRWVRNSKGSLTFDGKGAGDLALLVDVVSHTK